MCKEAAQSIFLELQYTVENTQDFFMLHVLHLTKARRKPGTLVAATFYVNIHPYIYFQYLCSTGAAPSCHRAKVKSSVHGTAFTATVQCTSFWFAIFDWTTWSLRLWNHALLRLFYSVHNHVYIDNKQKYLYAVKNKSLIRLSKGPLWKHTVRRTLVVWTREE